MAETTGHLARRLKAARVLSGKRVDELASDLGMGIRKVYRFERGDQVPDAIELDLIARATSQDLEFFLPQPSSDEGDGTLSTGTPGVNPDDAKRINGVLGGQAREAVESQRERRS